MKNKCLKLECEVCGKLSSIQVFFNKSGVVKYARSRHYIGRLNGKPQFEYHQLSLGFIQGKLNEMPKRCLFPNNGSTSQIINGDLDKAHSSTVLEKSWASSSVRIEHQP